MTNYERTQNMIDSITTCYLDTSFLVPILADVAISLAVIADHLENQNKGES